jgi:hemerythrin-like domain-containing protein
MTSLGELRPDTHEMVVIHRVYRRESRLLPELIRNVAVGDVRRADVVSAYAEDYLAALHLHHTVEDEVVWPLVRARADLGDAVSDRMAGQHQRIDETLRTIARLLPEWRRTAGGGVRDELAVGAEQHREALITHLDDEEAHVLPVIADNLTVAEWGMMGRLGAERTPKSKGFLTLGALLEEADDDEARIFLDKLPGPVLVLWRLIGRRQYTRYAAKARGSISLLIGDDPAGDAARRAGRPGSGRLGSQLLVLPRTTRTGQVALARTPMEVLPSSAAVRPRRPWEPITIAWLSRSAAMRSSVSATVSSSATATPSAW